MKLESTFAHNFVDACHIIPFSVSQDDKVNNGIALCPNLHRAFDRGMISIDDNYSIIVSDHVIEDDKHFYSLKRLQGQKIILPHDRQHYPSIDNISWHRANIFKN